MVTLLNCKYLTPFKIEIFAECCSWTTLCNKGLAKNLNCDSLWDTLLKKDDGYEEKILYYKNNGEYQ